MSTVNQSFCYPLFRSEGMDLDDLFAAAAGMGYQAVEWWFRDESFADQVACAQRHGLRVVSICGHRSIAEGLNNPSDHDRIEAELLASIDVARKNDIPNLICFSGNRREGQSDEEAKEACAAGLRRVAPIAQAAGVVLNMELLNARVNHPGYQCDHTAWGVDVCRRVDSPNVKLLYDIYHMQIMEGDVIRTIRENIHWIGHFHTAGNPGRQDLDDDQELNYGAICRAITETGYDRWLGHEFSPKADRRDALRRAFEICGAVKAAVDVEHMST